MRDPVKQLWHFTHMSTFLININGEFFDEKNARISVFDRGFLYGDSVYEVTRTFNRVPFRLDHHLERLLISAHKIDLLPTLSSEQIKSRVNQTIEASGHENIMFRIILTRGTNSDLGLDPLLASENNLIIISKKISPNPKWWLTDGLSLVFYQKQSSQKGALPKSGNYLENVLANKAALERGAYDAIMINNEFHATECASSNIWIIKDGVVYTPPLNDGVMEGLTRKTLFEMASRTNHFSLKEKSLTRMDILEADECFITSTTRDLVPVTKVEDRPVADGRPGKITLELLKSYLKFVSHQ